MVERTESARFSFVPRFLFVFLLVDFSHEVELQVWVAGAWSGGKWQNFTAGGAEDIVRWSARVASGENCFHGGLQRGKVEFATMQGIGVGFGRTEEFTIHLGKVLL